ncbi:MAG: fatty acid desaturase family protein [Myxococcales bacterium]|nr:fatty acid desaturase family protein [Myxococcales bacterium]
MDAHEPEPEPEPESRRRFRPTDVLGKDELRALLQRSDLRGLLAVATSWALVAVAFALVVRWPNVWTVAAALLILGGRHLGFAILMHEAAHRTLCRRRWLNDLVGQWLCAYPGWQDLHRYREHHLRHHAHTGSERDPDLDLVRPFPVSRASLARKLLRDLSGLTALRRVLGLVLMDLGYIDYTVSGTVRRIPGASERPLLDIVGLGVRNLHGVVLSNAALYGIVAAFGHGELFLLWVAAWATTFSAFLRIRSIAEHACTPAPDDPLGNTRTVIASPLARLLVAPHRVNFHLEHHLLMTVPFFRLPELHRRLLARGVLDDSPVARGYVEVLDLASRG